MNIGLRTLLIKSAISSGFPNHLLIPIAPPFCPIGVEKKESTGKEPGQLIGDEWHPVKWGNGVSDGVKAIADTAGCNVGLVLGQPFANLQNSRVVIVDVDLDGADRPQMVQFCDAIERAFRERVAMQHHEGQSRYVVWTRKTVAYRAAFMVRLPADQPPGKRHVVKLKNDQDDIGKSKVEFLTEGQYCVIGGKHQCGEDIKWYRSDLPDEFRELPVVREDSIPIFASWEALVTMTREALERAVGDPANPYPHTQIASRDHKPTYARPDQNADPRELAAPSAAALANLLNVMPNPSTVSRDDYVAVLLAAAGARYGLHFLRKMELEDENTIAEAAAGWASRWEDPAALSFEEEYEKWQTDWRRRDAYYSGWRNLIAHAQELGADVYSILLDQAQESFDAEEKPADLLIGSEWNDPAEHLAPDKTELSEFWLTTKFIEHAGGRIRYIPEEKRWIAWGRTDEGWFERHAQQWIRNKIRDFLNRLFIGREGMPTNEIRHFLTASKVHNLERLIADETAFPRDKLNHAPWFLQCPEVAYDLRTGERIFKKQQRANMDTRYTSVQAKEGPTPKWDALLYHLCEENEDTVEWLKHYLAYSILGEPRAHKFLYIWGTGLNGKSTLLHIMMGILGSYAGSIDRDVWLARGADKHPASLYKLRGLRLAVTSEMPPNEQWNESRLKAVTGQDMVEARPLHGQPQTFQPQAALIMVGQNIPMFNKIDNSITRRIAIIGTARSPKKVVPTLAEDILREEGAAILWDLIQRCSRIYQTGIWLPEMPAAMQAEVKDYLEKTDSFFAWASTELDIGEDYAETMMPLQKLIDRYVAYHKRQHANDPMAQMISVDPTRFMGNLRRVGAITRDQEGKPIRMQDDMGVRGCKFKIGAVA